MYKQSINQLIIKVLIKKIEEVNILITLINEKIEEVNNYEINIIITLFKDKVEKMNNFIIENEKLLKIEDVD